MGKRQLDLRWRNKGGGTPLTPPPVLEVVDKSISGKDNRLTYGKKKTAGTKLWMIMDRRGQSELMECDNSVIIKRVSVPARDLRILGPEFSHSSSILARKKAMVVNLKFIRAIVTAEEVLLLDPLCQEVLTFVDQLRQQLSHRSTSKNVADQMVSQDSEMLSPTETAEGSESKLPFEFQVLEIALEIVCTYLDSSVAELEGAVIVSIKNLQQVRSLKSNLTQLLSQVQKVRDEIEHLLDDNVNMTQLCLTRKLIQNQQNEALSGAEASISIISTASHSSRIGSVVSNYLNEKDVEDLEMLLEAYFVQLDGTRNKILSVREFIDDTEDYDKIRLDNQRNELLQLKLILTIASLAITVEIVIAGIFSLNIHCTLYDIHEIFGLTVGIMTASCGLLSIILIGYARWKKLLW